MVFSLHSCSNEVPDVLAELANIAHQTFLFASLSLVKNNNIVADLGSKQ